MMPFGIMSDVVGDKRNSRGDSMAAQMNELARSQSA